MVKNSLTNAGDTGLISGSGKSPEEGTGNLFQYSCLENPMDIGAWRATVDGIAKELDMIQRLNNSNLLVRNDRISCLLSLYFSFLIYKSK